MTTVRPFRALRYDPSRVELADVLAPPYDVVAADDRGTLYDRNPHNAIRLELTREVADEKTTDYAEIRETLDAWTTDGVLQRDAGPAIYALRQPYNAPDGSKGAREGFFALLHLEDYEARIVRPHERTLAGPKADRLKVLRAARANLSPVFLLYEDKDGEIDGLFEKDLSSPTVSCTDAIGETRLARVERPEAIEAVARALADRSVVIADGHHRYETALAYRDEQRAAGAPKDGPHEWILAYFANAYAPGSLLLPIHRLILQGAAPSEADWSARLPGWKQSTVPIPSGDAIPDLLAEHLEPLADHHAFAADDASGTLRIFHREKDDALTVRVIHKEIIEGVFGLDEDAVRAGAISYPKSAAQTATDLRRGEGAVALYLNALSPDDVFDVTGAGEVMPQKSTFFYPKLPTGLVFRTHEDDA